MVQELEFRSFRSNQRIENIWAKKFQKMRDKANAFNYHSTMYKMDLGMSSLLSEDCRQLSLREQNGCSIQMISDVQLMSPFTSMGDALFRNRDNFSFFCLHSTSVLTE
jgi:mannose/fructose/N-acetylgalactosamine-specific phosphotransferase system component IID